MYAFVLCAVSSCELIVAAKSLLISGSDGPYTVSLGGSRLLAGNFRALCSGILDLVELVEPFLSLDLDASLHCDGDERAWLSVQTAQARDDTGSAICEHL